MKPLAVLLLAPLLAPAYSVLTHEAIIDSAWDSNIKPLLQKRFPQASADDLVAAHAYAYGGCIIQDMGYYPFGSKFFSDLVHYVRSGDFIEALIRDSQDLNEYAFALGALAHYGADNEGHSIAVNRAVPMLYPKLRAKYGDNITYEQNPAAHLKTEFGFDVVQVAGGRYAPQAYHDFIGFEVSKPALERAFQDTYSLKLKDIFTSLDLALGTYRHTVSSLIPEMTRAAWAAKQDEIVRTHPGITRQQFLYNLSRASYEKEWGHDYRKPGFFARLIAFLFRILPKVGPFRALSFRAPTPEAERLFMMSFNRSLDDYRSSLAHPDLQNRNLDTGRPVHPGAYRLADRAYAHLLDKLADKNFERVSAALRDDILAFYRSAGPPATGKSKSRQKIMREVDQLRLAGTRSPSSKE